MCERWVLTVARATKSRCDLGVREPGRGLTHDFELGRREALPAVSRTLALPPGASDPGHGRVGLECAAFGQRTFERPRVERVADARGELGDRGPMCRPADEAELIAGALRRAQQPRRFGVALATCRHVRQRLQRARQLQPVAVPVNRGERLVQEPLGVPQTPGRRARAGRA